MKKARITALSAVIAACLGVFALLAIAGTKMASAETVGIPPIQLRQQLTIDVIRRDRDLLKMTSNWPTSVIVENVSDKNVSGFLIEVFAADDDGGPLDLIGWGEMPDFEKQDPLFKPGETRTIPLKASTIKMMEDNNLAHDKPLIDLQLADVWVDNDVNYKYKYGALLKRDPNDPKRYIVIVDSLGRNVTFDANGNRTYVGPLPKDHKHNHAVPLPHISRSVTPPKPLGCCTREFYNSAYLECNHFDPCDPTSSRKCRVENDAYTYCDACCSVNQQLTALYPCLSENIFCEYSCTETHVATHGNPNCTCCGCG